MHEKAVCTILVCHAKCVAATAITHWWTLSGAAVNTDFFCCPGVGQPAMCLFHSGSRCRSTPKHRQSHYGWYNFCFRNCKGNDEMWKSSGAPKPKLPLSQFTTTRKKHPTFTSVTAHKRWAKFVRLSAVYPMLKKNISRRHLISHVKNHTCQHRGLECTGPEWLEPSPSLRSPSCGKDTFLFGYHRENQRLVWKLLFFYLALHRGVNIIWVMCFFVWTSIHTAFYLYALLLSFISQHW